MPSRPNPWGTIEALRARGLDKWTFTGPAEALTQLDELVEVLGDFNADIKSRSDAFAFICREAHARYVPVKKKEGSAEPCTTLTSSSKAPKRAAKPRP